MFALWSSLNHIPIQCKGPIKKTSHLRPIYHTYMKDRNLYAYAMGMSPCCDRFDRSYVYDHVAKWAKVEKPPVRSLLGGSLILPLDMVGSLKCRPLVDVAAGDCGRIRDTVARLTTHSQHSASSPQFLVLEKLRLTPLGKDFLHTWIELPWSPCMSCWLGPPAFLRKQILSICRCNRCEGGMTHSKGSEDRLSEANVLSSFELSDMPWLCLPFVGSIFVVSKGFDAL